MIWVLLALVFLGAVAAWVLLFRLLRQHGQLLARFDRLEERQRGAGLEEVFELAAEPSGVPEGSVLPSFRLPDLNGGTAGLEDFRGKRVLLVHWSPACGFCDTIAEELAEATGALRARNTELVLVSSGDPETNRTLAKAYGLDCPMLLEDDAEAVDAFAGVGTPAAYLLDEEGRVASGLVLGADKVPDLLREALNGLRRLPTERPPSESRIERDGLELGARATRVQYLSAEVPEPRGPRRRPP